MRHGVAPINVPRYGKGALDLSEAACAGWVELRALLNKAQKWMMEGLCDVKASLPFPLRGPAGDNGSEFVNRTLVKWCADEEIRFTRSRPYHKNDNADSSPISWNRRTGPA